MRYAKMERVIETVIEIFSNLYDSDFASEFGLKSVRGLEEYQADIAFDIFNGVYRKGVSENEKEWLTEQFRK